MSEHPKVEPPPPPAAAEICRHASLSDKAMLLLRPGQALRQFLDALLAESLYSDAIRFLAFALPRREAVWWGCLCIRLAAGQTLEAVAEKTLRPVVQWVLEPSEPHRKEAEVAASTETAHGYLAQAVAWTGGSLTPPPLPAVPPSPQLSPRAIGGAILMSAVEAEPTKIKERMRHFLVLGVHVSHGKYLWEHRAGPHSGSIPRH